MPKTVEMAQTQKEKIKFQLNFMLMMLQCGRGDKAQAAFEKAMELIDGAVFVEEETA